MGSSTINQLDKIKQLEQDLKMSNEVSLRLQKDLDVANNKLSKIEEPGIKKKPPPLGNLKNPTGDTVSKKIKLLYDIQRNYFLQKVSRESLTRGGSQDDPAQLLRDLQDSLEREADLREQLRFAEEEVNILRVFFIIHNTHIVKVDAFAIYKTVFNKDGLFIRLFYLTIIFSTLLCLFLQAQNLRKKVSRIEDDNESLVLQLKKMATRARSMFFRYVLHICCFSKVY